MAKHIEETEELNAASDWIIINGNSCTPVRVVINNGWMMFESIRKLLAYVDKIGVPLAVYPNGTTEWVGGTKKVGKRMVLTDDQIKDIVSLYAARFTVTNKAIGKQRHVYGDPNGHPGNQASMQLNRFATKLLGLVEVRGTVIVMPGKRRV